MEIITSLVQWEVTKLFLGKNDYYDNLRLELLFQSQWKSTRVSFSRICIERLVDLLWEESTIWEWSDWYLIAQIAALFLQDIIPTKTTWKNMGELLAKSPYPEIRDAYEKSQYFSWDFDDIVRFLIQAELWRIQDAYNNDYFYFSEEWKEDIHNFWETEDEILDAIKQKFWEEFAHSIFEIDHLTFLNISWLSRENLETAKKEFSKKKIIRI